MSAGEGQQEQAGLPHGLRLLTSTSSPHVGGRTLPVTAELRNDGASDVDLFVDPVVFLLLDQDDVPVTDLGWRHGTTLERRLDAGAGHVVSGGLDLVGPRGGARRVPLRPGRYRLRAQVVLGLMRPDCQPLTATLVSTPVPVELVAE